MPRNIPTKVMDINSVFKSSIFIFFHEISRFNSARLLVDMHVTRLISVTATPEERRAMHLIGFQNVIYHIM